MKEKTFHVAEDDARLIHHALKNRLWEVENDLRLLQTAKRRELRPEERARLPSTLVDANRNELIAQVDAWLTLRDTYRSLISRFDTTTW